MMLEPPAARFSVRPFFEHPPLPPLPPLPRLHRWLPLPRAWVCAEGDGTNEWIVVSFELAAAHGEPVFAAGVELTIPPSLFWALPGPLWRWLRGL